MLGGKKTSTCYHTGSVGQNSKRTIVGSLLRVSPGGNQRVDWAASSSGGQTRKGSASKFSQVVGGVHFLVAVESWHLASSK